MGYDGKYGRVTTEHGDIPGDEPVIVFRAQDKVLAAVLSEYWNRCKAAGSPQQHLDGIEAAYTRVCDWQEANPDKVKTPDT